LALEERGWSYVMAVDPKEIARPAHTVPYQPARVRRSPPSRSSSGELVSDPYAAMTVLTCPFGVPTPG
ncbi:hypothetical protein, partial [Streptomyces sp. NPDC051561]|uniref:hypothetical protein n=1 Tax=Streptomyces sp. NPDC051561 TaxID=3365658 RepID=UPI0037BB3360